VVAISDRHWTQASDVCQQLLVSMADAYGFECGEPAPLRLVQATEKQVDLMGIGTIRMGFVWTALRALAPVRWQG